MAIDGAEPTPVFGRGFVFTWPGRAVQPVRLPHQEALLLGEFLVRVRRGEIDYPAVRHAAALLGRLFAVPTPMASDSVIELEAPPHSLLALTDVPWEASGLGDDALPDEDGEVYDRLAASLPLCRIVPSASSTVILGDHRPRLMIVVSNPPGIDGGQVAVGPLQTACRQVLHGYPAFQLRVLSGPITWPTVAPVIRQFQPNVLIIVAHGSSDPAGGQPTIAFVRDGDIGGVDRVPVATIAAEVALAKSCVLAAMIACDTTRSTSYSAAVEVIRAGVAESVAMHGSVTQGCAREFLSRFLSGVLAGLSTPCAAAEGRRAAAAHPDCFMPAVFRASAYDHRISEFSNLGVTYERALGTLATRTPPNLHELERPESTDCLRRFLQQNGVYAVVGGFGSGVSTLLRAAARDMLAGVRSRSSRPVLYVDLDRRAKDVDFAAWVCRELLACTAPVLRPKSAPDLYVRDLTGEDLGLWAVDAEITLILDNLPPNLTAGDRAFLVDLSAEFCRPGANAALIVGHDGAIPSDVCPTDTATIAPFSLSETSQYASMYIPDTDAGELYRSTGGTPLLLDMERRMMSRTRGAVGTPRLDGDILERYLDRVESILSPAASQVAHRLLRFLYPIERQTADEFVATNLPSAIDELVQSGLALSFQDFNAMWVRIPPTKANALRARHDPDRADAEIAEAFIARYAVSRRETIERVATREGAFNYLNVVQRSLASTGDAGTAISMPIWAQGTPLPAMDLFRLFAQSVAIVEQLPEGMNALPELQDVLLAAVRSALAVGRADQASKWLGIIPDDLPSMQRCEKLLLEAALLKDTGNHRAVEEIVIRHKRALSIVASAAEIDRQLSEELAHRILIESLPMALFLTSEPAALAAVRLEQTLAAASNDDRALLLATLAEREMKEDAARASWSAIADWVTEATGLAASSQDRRLQTYCLYQQAQYLRQRPESRLADAWKTYDRARLAAAKGVEPRREGLALLRQVELEEQHPVLRPAGSWPGSRLAQLDDVIAALSEDRADTLGMRTLGRLQLLAAALDQGGARARLAEAARAFATPALGSDQDSWLFADTCRRALELDLGPAGDFLLGQRFLAALRPDLRSRLGIALDLEHPDRTLYAISQWVSAHRQKGR